MSKKLDKICDKIRDFLVVTSKLAPVPGFSRVLGTDGQSILKQSLHETNLFYAKEKKELTFRYHIPDHVCLGNVSASMTPSVMSKKLPLSGFLAVFDDVTTWILAAEDKGSRPGVSTHLSVHLGPLGKMGEGMNAGDIVDIRVRKVRIGKIFGFAEAEAVCPQTNNVICTGRHIKYLPMPIVQEMALGPLLPLTKWYINYFASKNDEIISDRPQDGDLFAFDELSHDCCRGTFFVQKYHCNPLGSCHGGCHAMMMELIANGFVSKDNKYGDSIMQLESISLSYMSSGKNDLTLNSEFIHNSDKSASVSIKATGNRGLPVSEGILTYRKS